MLTTSWFDATAQRRARTAVRAVALGCLLSLLGAFHFNALAGSTEVDPTIFVFGGVAAVAYLVPGLVLLWRRDWHPVGWLLCLIAVGMAVTFAGDWGASWFGGPWTRWVLQTFTGSLFWLGFVALLAVFPDGLGAQPRVHRRFGRGLLLVGGLMAMIEGLQTRVGPPDGTLASPLGRLAVVPYGLGNGATTLVTGGVLLLALAGMVVRYRTAVAGARRQYRWLVSAVVVLVATAAVAVVVGKVTGVDDGPQWLAPMLAYLALPVAFVVAILRYRLYEIDRLVSRTVTFSIVVVVLALVYVSAVALLTQMLPADNDVAVAASTLMAAAAFRPAHRHIRERVERRFNRSRFDAEQELQRFSRGLKGQTDVRAVEEQLATVVDRTLRPATLSLWVRGS